MIKLKSLLKEDHDPKLIAKHGEALLKKFGGNRAKAIQHAKTQEQSAKELTDDDFWTDMLGWLHGSYGNKVTETGNAELLHKTKNYSLVRNTAGREFVIMTKKAYSAAHPDQKSKSGGNPMLSVNNPKTGGTELWPVEFIGEALITEKQPDAAWIAAKKIQHDIFDFMSKYGRDPAMKARSNEIVDLHRAINRIVADLGQQVYHSQPGES